MEKLADDTAQARAAQKARVEAKTRNAIEYLAAIDLAAAASMLRISKIEVDDEVVKDHKGREVRDQEGNPVYKVPTAQLVRRGDDFTIQMNAHFCDRSQRDINCILLHELLHHIMRHLEGERLGPSPQLSNIVEDAFINYTIFLLNPTLATFFREFYAEDKSPHLFLRSRSKPEDMIDDQVYRALYKGKLTEKDLYEYLEKKFKGGPPQIILIGGHPESEGGNPIPEDQVPDIVKEIGEQLGNTKKGGELAGHFNKLLQEFIKVKKLNRLAGMEEVFKISLVESCKSQIVESMVGDVKDVINRQVFMPENIHRQDVIMIMAGVQPFLWRSQEANKKQGAVNVYIDVSGSMGREVEFIYGCCVAFEEYLNTDIYLFSNKIDSITLAELKKGKVSSTYGTDFDCVVRHFLDSEADRCILFSDGYASLNQPLHQELEKSGKLVNGVVTQRGQDRVLKSFCNEVFRIPKEN